MPTMSQQQTGVEGKPEAAPLLSYLRSHEMTKDLPLEILTAVDAALKEEGYNIKSFSRPSPELRSDLEELLTDANGDVRLKRGHWHNVREALFSMGGYPRCQAQLHATSASTQRS